MLAHQLCTSTRPKRFGKLHRTKMQYVLRVFSCTPLVHQSHIASQDTKSSISSQNFILVRFKQFLNSVSWIILATAGIKMYASNVHFSNTSSPISSSPSPRVTVVNPEQCRNANPPIFLTAFGKTIFCSELHSLNANAPISSSPLPRVFIVLTAAGMTF